MLKGQLPFYARQFQHPTNAKKALEVAEDMLKIRMARKRELIDKRINGLDAKIATLGELLPDSRKKYLVVEKEMFTQRAEHIQNLQIRDDDKHSLKCFNQSRT